MVHPYVILRAVTTYVCWPTSHRLEVQTSVEQKVRETENSEKFSDSISLLSHKKDVFRNKIQREDT